MSNARQLAANLPREGGLSSRNMIINGAMTVAQRGTSILATNPGYKTVDRMFHNISAGAWTCTQESDAPVGFSKSAKLSCVSTTGASAWDVVQFAQIIEGNNLQHLSYGTASAQSVTLSFWVKANVTGTYAVRLYNPEGQDRLISKNYTINASGVWEYKTVTFAGDTARNIADGAVYGLNVAWWVDAGSNFSSGTTSDVWRDYQGIDEAPNQVRVGASAGNYFQITGVQLEVGDTATPFEHEPYGVTLQKCLRFFQTYENPPLKGVVDGIRVNRSSMLLPVQLRAVPTTSFVQTGTSGQMSFFDGNITSRLTGIYAHHSTTSLVEFDFTIANAFSTDGFIATTYQSTGDQTRFTFDAEL